MFKKLRLHLAHRRELRRLEHLLRDTGQKISRAELLDYIKNREVVVLKKKRRTIGVIVYTLIGVVGLLSFLHVRKLAVAKSLRGRGYGSLLLTRIKDLTRRKKADGFFLRALVSAKGFYERRGLSGIARIFWWRRK